MDTILKMIFRGVEQIIGRLSGPLNFRLFIMPLIVTILAIRADLRDAREGRPTVLGAFFMDPVERRRILHSALKDIGKVFIMAIVLDTAYQLIVFQSLYPLQVLFVAVVCAVIPYFLVRGPILRSVHLLYRKWTKPAHAPAVKTNPDTENHERS